MLNVTTTTVARFARSGALRLISRTPGGHRRYRRADVQRKLEEDAVRLYEQGWPISRVAKQFRYTDDEMRQTLLKHTSLRIGS